MRLGGRPFADDLFTYDASPPPWIRYSALIVPLVTVTGLTTFVWGSWWRIASVVCGIVLVMLITATVRWERDHKRPTA